MYVYLHVYIYVYDHVDVHLSIYLYLSLSLSLCLPLSVSIYNIQPTQILDARRLVPGARHLTHSMLSNQWIFNTADMQGFLYFLCRPTRTRPFLG